ncbi:MAG TPA: hypothetical protein DEP99_01335 [Nitrospiraceae bacterium]|nr:hypothetical protein [Nitrospiraceae bacterium]
MSKSPVKKLRRPRLPVEAVLKLRKSHPHTPKRGQKGYNRRAIKKEIEHLPNSDLEKPDTGRTN